MKKSEIKREMLNSRGKGILPTTILVQNLKTGSVRQFSGGTEYEWRVEEKGTALIVVYEMDGESWTSVFSPTKVKI